jgi:hypothetical protein
VLVDGRLGGFAKRSGGVVDFVFRRGLVIKRLAGALFNERLRWLTRRCAFVNCSAGVIGFVVGQRARFCSHPMFVFHSSSVAVKFTPAPLTVVGFLAAQV